MILDRLGFVGWGDCEPTILAALVVQHPILFVGAHGCFKTDGSRLLMEALLGPEVRFQKYDLHHLSKEDLLGYANPFSLQNGMVEHVPTPISIWGAQAVLLDELNRVNPMISSKSLELVRSRTVMGLPTGVEYVFASLNPPGRYQTSYLDLPLAARFSIVEVPGIKELRSSVERILGSSEVDPEAPVLLRSLVETAREVKFSDANLSKTHKIIAKVVRELLESEVLVEPRELKSMRDLLLACEGLNSACVRLGLAKVCDTRAKARVLMSKIPEAFQVCRQQTENQVIFARLLEVLTGFELEDPIVMAGNALELLETPDPDQSFWAAQVVRFLSSEEDPDLLRLCIQRATQLASLDVLDRDNFNSIVHTALGRLFECDPHLETETTPLGWSRHPLTSYLRGLARPVKEGEPHSAA